MYSTFSHGSQETFSTENVLAGRGPHRRLEHLLAHGAVEVVLAVGGGRRGVLGHGGGGERRRRPRWQWRPGSDSLREPGAGPRVKLQLLLIYLMVPSNLILSHLESETPGFLAQRVKGLFFPSFFLA